MQYILPWSKCVNMNNRTWCEFVIYSSMILYRWMISKRPLLKLKKKVQWSAQDSWWLSGPLFFFLNALDLLPSPWEFMSKTLYPVFLFRRVTEPSWPWGWEQRVSCRLHPGILSIFVSASYMNWSSFRDSNMRY